MPLVPLFALFLYALQRAAHQLSLERSQVVDEQFAVEMVDLVLQDPGIEAVGGKLEEFASLVDGRDFDVRVARHVTVDIGDAQAPLLGGDHTLADVDHGIDQGDGRQARLGAGYVDDDDPPTDADLWRRQSHAFGLLEAVEEIADQSPDLVVDLGDGAAGTA